MSPQRSLNRRTFIASSGAVSLLAVAGCLNGDDDEGNGNGNGNETDGNGNGNETDGNGNGNETDGNETDGGDDTMFDATILWVEVVDEETGDPVEAATVTVTNGSETEEETGSNGEAFFRDLETGEHTVTAETDAGEAEGTVELEEGDDGEIELEVPTPDEEEDGGENGDGSDNESDDGNESDNESDDGNESDNESDGE